jgi:hypothetical protein
MAESELEIGQATELARKKDHRKRWLVIFIIVILVLIIGIARFVTNSLNSSVNGVISSPTKSQQNAGLSFNATPVNVNGTNISFSYPQALAVDPAAQKPTYPILESYVYKYSDIETWLLAISIIHLESNNLTGDSGYYSRLQDPAEYSQSSVTLSGKTYIVMSDKSAVGFSEIAFTMHNGMAADISLLGNDALGTSELQKTFNMVLSSFSWK